MFAPLEDVDFDREDQTYYWKGGHDQWLLHRPEDVRVDKDVDEVVDQRGTREWSSAHGELLLERIHFQPSVDPGARQGRSHPLRVLREHLVDPGIGQVRRRLVGLWQFMESADLDDLAPDLSEYYEYDHATPCESGCSVRSPSRASRPTHPSHPPTRPAGATAGSFTPPSATWPSSSGSAPSTPAGACRPRVATEAATASLWPTTTAPVGSSTSSPPRPMAPTSGCRRPGSPTTRPTSSWSPCGTRAPSCRRPNRTPRSSRGRSTTGWGGSPTSRAGGR